MKNRRFSRSLRQTDSSGWKPERIGTFETEVLILRPLERLYEFNVLSKRTYLIKIDLMQVQRIFCTHLQVSVKIFTLLLRQ